MMCKISRIAAALCAAAFLNLIPAFAQDCASKLKPSQTILLYPKGQDVDEGVEGAKGPGVSTGATEKEYMDERGFYYNTGDEARFDLYFPKKPNGQMVVVCPGGGYVFTSLVNEGIYVADWMTSKGITVAVVKYRLPAGHWEAPLNDIQNVFRYCRHHAAEWGIHQIGVIGFSAGGHLAASAANLFVDDVTRPDFSILFYPVITMDKKLTHWGTRVNLIGPDEVWEDETVSAKAYKEANELHKKLIRNYSMEKQVTDKTASTFIISCTDDKCVPVENSIMYYESLLKNKVPVEMHILPKGGHGWGFNLEKWVGKGHDAIGYARNEAMNNLDRWLRMVREGKIK